MHNWTSQIRAALASTPHPPDDDVIEELAQHARAMFDRARADGASAEEAERRVMMQIEGWRSEAEALRRRSKRQPAVVAPAVTATARWHGLGSDVRYAARLLRRQVRFALLVILTMALGIGATTVLFSVTYGVLMKPLPWPSGDRLVQIKETRGGAAPRFGEFTNAAYLAWSEQASTIESMAAWSQRPMTLSGTGEPERIRLTTATASLFDVLGTRPLIGSFFAAKDEPSPVIVLSEGLWRQRFGADPGVLGRAVQLDGQPYTIVGVMRDEAMFPDRQSRAIVPFAVRPPTGNYLSMFNAIAALRPGATAAQAAAEGTARGRYVADTGMTTRAIFGNSGPVEILVHPLHAAVTAEVRQPLIVLLIAVALLLVTATANVASLQLARMTTRSREMAIRAALGAGGARVVRQLLVESLMLGGVGGAAGLALAWALHRSLPALLPADFPRATDLGVDLVVVAFAVGVSIAASVLFGVLPALRVRRLNLVETLSEDGTSAIGTSRRSRTAQARMLIMAGQVAIACALLVGASLLGRSFVALLAADRGLDPARVLSARVSLPNPFYTPVRRVAILTEMLAGLATVPGVRAAAFSTELPLIPGGSTSGFTLPSRSAQEGSISVQASPRVVSPRYFSALGLDVLRGRSLTDADTAASEPVVVVNETFARRYLGDAPLDARIPMAVWEGDTEATAPVVGVVEDVRYIGAQTTTLPEMYLSYRQLKTGVPQSTMTILLRSDEDPSQIAPALRSIVAQADGRLVAEAVMTLEDRLLMSSLARPRLYAVVLGGFAGVALLIAAVGLFGVLSYGVAQRSRELAVRSALGARQIDIVTLVLRQGAFIAGAGIVAGLFMSAAAARWIATLLYGVSPRDPLTYAVVPLLLLVVAAIACIIPARRAAKLDPLRILKGTM